MKPVFRPQRRAMLMCSMAAALALPWLQAQAQTWPDKPIRVIVPYAAGQGADVLMRLLGQELSSSLGQPVIIENKAGAGGNIGTTAAAKSAPDGYTFLLGTNATNAANEFLYSNPGYHAATDFDSVAMIGLLPMVISTSAVDLPVNGVAKLVALAKAKPESLNVGLPSTTANVVFAQFVKMADAPLFGVKYKSSGQALTDTIGGQIPLVIDTVTASRSHIASGKLKALGITSRNASEMLPGVQSVADQGITGFDVVAWDALFAPKGIPAPALQKMSEHIAKALALPEMRKRMMDIGVDPLSMNPAQLRDFVKNERQKWGDVITSANIRID